MAADREQKLIELLHQAVPAATVFALLVNPANPAAESQTRDALATAGNTGLQINVLPAKAESDFDAVFVGLADMRAGGLAIAEDELLSLIHISSTAAIR